MYVWVHLLLEELLWRRLPEGEQPPAEIPSFGAVHAERLRAVRAVRVRVRVAVRAVALEHEEATAARIARDSGEWRE
eukprot:6200143-Pleurochrysis_carterae.AAC.1